jgi:hypothetical protein
VLLVIALSSVIQAAPPRIVRDVDLLVELRPLLTDGLQSGGLPGRSVRFDDESDAGARWVLQWPDPTQDSRLDLRVSGQPGIDGQPHSITVSGTLKADGDRLIRLRRSFRIREGGSDIYELYRQGDSALTLTLKVRSELKGWSPAAVHAGERVYIDIFIEAIAGDRIVSLESNRLNTFLGEPVEYSFRRGQGKTLEDIRLTLTPGELDQGGYEVEAKLDGSLPGDDGRSYLDRHETLLLSEASTATLRVVRGDPPVGYRFRVSVSR